MNPQRSQVFQVRQYTDVDFPSAPQSHLPFAVVGSTEEVKIGNKMVKARQYPWGTVQGKPGSHPAQEMSVLTFIETAATSPSPHISPQF